MSLQFYLAYVASCFIAAMIPGPTTTLVIANSLRHDIRTGLLNAAGTQLGCGAMLTLLLSGLATVIASMSGALIGGGLWLGFSRVR